MASITFHELQEDLVSSSCDVVSTLRKAQILSAQVHDDDMTSWIKSELNGYKCSIDHLPPYRKLRGSLKAKNPFYGWIPCVIEDKTMDELFNLLPFLMLLRRYRSMQKKTN